MSQSIDPKETREGRTRQRAYEIYQSRDGQEGDGSYSIKGPPPGGSLN